MLKMINHEADDGRWYPFRVTAGLIEGYSTNAKLHRLEEVKEVVKNWWQLCEEENFPKLFGTIDEKTMMYERRKDGEALEEPVVIFEGEVNPLRITADLGEEQYLMALWQLAELLADALNQTRVYIKFKQRTLVLEQCK